MTIQNVKVMSITKDERRKAITSKFEDVDIIKGKKVPVGTEHSGYKKVKEGIWRKVKKGGDIKGKHYADMNVEELRRAAKMLKIKHEGKTIAELRKEVGEKIVEKNMKDWKASKGKKKD